MDTTQTHHQPYTHPGRRPPVPPQHTGSARVDTAQIGGAFSVVGDAPMELTAVPGMTVHVNKGGLWIAPADAGDGAYVSAGGRYISEQVGVLTLTRAHRTELSITLP